MSFDSDESLFASDEDCNINKVVNERREENDVILETPQKIKTKDIFKKKLKSYASCSEHKLSELCVTRNYTELPNMNSYGSGNLNSRYKSPYVFYDLKEILNFTENCQPANPNIKIFGIYKQNHILEHKQNCIQIVPLKLLINCRLLLSVPIVDQNVEMYGYVTYYRKDAKYFPIFIVKFWISINSDFNKYLNCSRRQRNYVPCCYKKIMKVDLLHTSSVHSKNDYYSFEEIDESCLIRHVDHLEQNCNEINEIMNISDDIFV